MAKQGAFGLLFLLLGRPAQQVQPPEAVACVTAEPEAISGACAAWAPQRTLPLAFSAKVWRIMSQRGFPRLKFAVIRQFRAESVIEISWLRFRDSIAFSMCF
mgnify:CR=1 FL=1